MTGRNVDLSVTRKRSALALAFRTFTIVLLALVATMPAAADKAKSLYDQGRDFEAREKWDSAYEAYKQARELKPKEVQYRAAFERMKFRAAAEHVKAGQKLREAGSYAEAQTEFETALKIDPSSFIAQQEMRRTRDLIDQGTTQQDVEQRTKASNERTSRVSSAVELAPISAQPITLRMSEDSKVIYDTIGKLAGINVLFDPDYTGRRIRIELNGVSLAEALEVVSMQSKTFWRPVTPNTIYIASDTGTKRKEVEQQVLRTFYLTNLSTATELQDVTNTLRTVLELTRLQMLPTQNAIVVRGTPDKILLAEKIVNDLDKAKAEVVVEVAVMQVSRDKLRQLGIQYPFTTNASPTITLQNPSTSTTSGTGTGTGTTTGNNTSNLTLNDLANLDARNFALSIPSSSVAFLMNDSNTKVIQNPQVRALDGQKATLKIGERVPIATGSFQPGIGGVGINPLVNTQFQYIDVGVNIDVTPHVFVNRDVDLKVMLEISSVTRQVTLGGIDQPVIGQRKIEHEIRLKEGEVNLLGGLLEESESMSMSGLPWLSQIPVLKYLFGREQKERINSEIVFALIPHVVRSVELTDMNTRAVDVGTENAITVRKAIATTTTNPTMTPAAAPAQPARTPAPQQPVPQTQQGPVTTPSVAPPQQTAPVAQPGDNQAQQLTNNSGPILSFDPPTVSAATNSTFAVNVSLAGAQNVFSVPAQISYDPKLMQLVNVSNGGALSPDGQAVALVHREDTTAGSIQVTASRPPGAPGVAVNGTVFTLTFVARAPGQSTLSINRAVLRDASMAAIPASGSQAVITIR